MNYKVFIPTAGLGSRLKEHSQYINKALVTLANRPIISFIIEKIPKEIEIVVALGYKRDSVKEFLTIAYPDRNFVFVDIDKYEGEGSGLGYTLLKCKDHLQCPFIFWANDTVVTDDIPSLETNWMGYSEKGDISNYRSIRIDNNDYVAEICSKGASGEVKPYIGLAGIKDYQVFWDAMEKGIIDGAIQVGESFGLKFLISQGIKSFIFNWFDMGNLDSLEDARNVFVNSEEPNILEKDGETIWFVNDNVIKFSIDKDFIRDRVNRVAHLAPYVPNVVDSTDNMYVYKHVKGEMFSKNSKLSEFKYFLEWMDGFWKKKKLTESESGYFRRACFEFYNIKTFKRVKQYFTRFEQIDIEEIINGRQVPKLTEILEKIDWDYLADGVPARFHGDLHFENILINEDSQQPFTLLDWRQNFGGLYEYGDIYYDFAKLNHGLIISHELINKNYFNVTHKLDKVDYDFLRKQCLVDCENYLRNYIINKGYDFKKVQIITALIFLNIAPLHHYPYTLLLFYLGKSMLHDLQI
jgi:choline kinase